MKKKQYKILSAILIVALLFIFTSGTIITLKNKSDLYIKIVELNWPKTSSMSRESYSDFSCYCFVEIWNRLERNITIFTTHWFLITIRMEASLDNNLYEFVYGDIYLGILNSHILEPGKTIKERAFGFEIGNYNKSIPPDGIYTIWAEFDGSTEHTVNTYKTTVKIHDNKTSFINQNTPSTWGTTKYWTPTSLILIVSGFCILAVFTLMLIYKYMRNKFELENSV